MAKAHINKDEPSMLMYADDMVIWGRSEEEFKNKLKQACMAFDNIGMKLSSEKTEMQHNKWVVPSMENKSIIIKHEDKTEIMNFMPMNKAIRYLGAWTTVDGNTDWGLEILQEKMNSRLDRIQKLNAHALQKATVVKGKILGLWNYTAAIQDIGSDVIEKWESKLCQTVGGKDIGSGLSNSLKIILSAHGICPLPSCLFPFSIIWLKILHLFTSYNSLILAIFNPPCIFFKNSMSLLMLYPMSFPPTV